ncbi:glycosyltransferase [Pseudonocardia phyllosphaerae]|uniref:glycosyltransferase n=1 Tax=Pseudonocardia phyllosphaerae TaxID=3390502 RepID=UPI00397C9761
MSPRPGTPRPVLLVMPSLGHGGAERHGVRLVTALDRARWAPHVLVLDDGPLRAELEAAGIGVRVVPVPGGPRGLRATRDAVRAEVDAVRPAVVLAQHLRADLPVRAALAGTGVPYLCFKHTYGHIGHRGLRERMIEKATGGAVTRYGAVCHTQVRYLTGELGLDPRRISVLPNAVPVPETPPAPATGDAATTVLMAAAMRADKDHDLVLRAWPAVLRAVPEARLCLAGDGPCRADLERRAAELGITGSVEFLGVRDDVEDLLAGSRALVLASYAVECFPYAVLEAMAAARAVVSTDVAGLPEMVDDGVTGRLVPPHDPDALAAALVESLSPAADGWGAAGHARAATVFPYDGWAARADALLQTVAGTPGRTEHGDPPGAAPDGGCDVRRAEPGAITPPAAVPTSSAEGHRP